MPRPRRFRRVRFEPNITYFKPAGVKMIDLEESILTVDEFEAVRLKDLEGLEQDNCAKKMNISQPTFFRLLDSARKKIADAIVNGKAIKIEGGVYKMVGFGRNRGGRGRMGGPFAAGPGGTCICPKCKYEVPHQVGTPCYQIKCPKCGSSMVRGD
jgi:hypothetical protein